MNRTLATITLLVPDYDEAIAHYCGDMGFHLVEDTALDTSKRWVVVSPGDGSARSARLLLARASDPRQSSAIGDQAGGRVFLFLETDDFARDYQRFQTIASLTFLEPQPRREPYGTVIQFQDKFGNKWDLIEPV